MNRFRFSLACTVLSGMLASSALAETFKLASLDWPPYTGDELAGKGVTSQVVNAVFEQAGNSVTMVFLPWQRAVYTARNDAEFIGYFPEYFDPSSPCLFSDPIGTGPLGFAELAAKPVSWTTLSDLKSIKIGVVSGYVNTVEFDAMAAAGELNTDSAIFDEQNLLKLAKGRVGLAVVDQNVMQYLLTTSPKLKEIADTLQFNSKLLEDKSLHVCFTNSPAGKAALEQFNASLKQVEVKQLLEKASY